jgi:hypothetical protein
MSDGFAKESGDPGEVGVRPVTFNFTEQAYSDLVRLAQNSGRTIGDVLQHAIGLEKWFNDVMQSGARILVERPGGRLQEISLR